MLLVCRSMYCKRKGSYLCRFLVAEQMWVGVWVFPVLGGEGGFKA